MKQSRLASFSESAINIAVGFGISFVAQLVFLPMLGVPILLWQNTAFALIMTVISLARSYILRRLFEYFQIRIPLSPGALAIIAERNRQKEVEGFASHDDLDLLPGELARAGAAYAIFARAHSDENKNKNIWSIALQVWPWTQEWWKPTGFRRDLVKAGALILAELDRMDAERKRGRA